MKESARENELYYCIQGIKKDAETCTAPQLLKNLNDLAVNLFFRIPQTYFDSSSLCWSEDFINVKISELLGSLENLVVIITWAKNWFNIEDKNVKWGIERKYFSNGYIKVLVVFASKHSRMSHICPKKMNCVASSKHDNKNPQQTTIEPCRRQRLKFKNKSNFSDATYPIARSRFLRIDPM